MKKGSGLQERDAEAALNCVSYWQISFDKLRLKENCNWTYEWRERVPSIGHVISFLLQWKAPEFVDLILSVE